MLKHLVTAGALALFSLPVSAHPYAPAMKAYLEDILSSWAHDPVLVAAVKAQNQKTKGYTQAEINTMDQKWQYEAKLPQSDLVGPVLSGPVADFLRARIAESNGAITEVIVMDARGLNVAVSQLTSDYWQGDEAKFQLTYPLGPDGRYFGEVELDESTGAVQGQVSVTLCDPESDVPIGVLTVGINLNSLS